MKLLTFASFILSLGAFPSGSAAQSDLLDGAQLRSVELRVNDVVYDPFRDVLYASVPSTGPLSFANSIVTIDPATGAVLDSIVVGNNPNTLAISGDASRVYIGVDGESSMRWWQPADDQLGALRPLVSHFGDPAVAFDMAVLPNRADAVVVSVDEIGSTANGDLVLFTDSDATAVEGLFDDANFIGFVNATTMASFDDSNTGFEAKAWQLNAQTLTEMTSRNQVVDSFTIEAEVASDGRFYFTDGTVLDGATLSVAGSYDTQLNDGMALVEPVPALGLTYFLGPGDTTGAPVALRAFDSQTFLELDAIVLPFPLSAVQGRGELIIAGENRLAFVWKPNQFSGPGGSGILHIIDGVPVQPIPEPAALALVASAALACSVALRRRCAGTIPL